MQSFEEFRTAAKSDATDFWNALGLLEKFTSKEFAEILIQKLYKYYREGYKSCANEVKNYVESNRKYYMCNDCSGDFIDELFNYMENSGE